MDDNIFGEPISVYTRQQAIEDGTLVDCTEMAREAGLKFPTAITSAVWGIIADIPPYSGQEVKGRLWDVLWMLVMRIHKTPNIGNLIFYKIIIDRTNTQEKILELKSVVGPGDDPSPVITVMLPDED